MKTLTIEVTQEDIERGVKQECWDCPIALALFRTTGKEWSVAPSSCRELGTLTDYIFPAEATEFIRSFDLGYPVSPFSFKLEVPE
jgi:hypothetical protein